VLRTGIFMRVAVSNTAAKDLGKSTGYVTRNVETPGGSVPLPPYIKTRSLEGHEAKPG
jgi:hypothetical protein